MFGSNVLKGVLLLARGNPAGIAEFGGTNDALLASLAPLIAFPLVETVLAALQGQPAPAAISFLSQLCCVLAVSVAMHSFAALAGRDAFWIRTATALNWSLWFVIPMILLADFCRALLVDAGMAQSMAFEISMLALCFYLFWYNCFTVRAGLQVGIIAAIGIVMATNVIVGLLSIGPALLSYVTTGVR